MAAGRPPKFSEPSRPVTVTLPERILQRLQDLDADRGKAIVRCVDALGEASGRVDQRVEVVRISDRDGLIVIGPCRYLAQISWLRLIEIAPARFLLSMPTGTDVSSLEVALMDVIEHLPEDASSDRVMLEELRRVITHHRRQQEVSKGAVLFVAI